MTRLHQMALAILLVGPVRARAAVPEVTLVADPMAMVSASGLTPPPPGAVGPVTEVRRHNPDGSEELVVDTGFHQSLHFGIGLSQLFAGTAGAQGYARAKVGVLHLSTSALASLNTRRYEGPGFVNGTSPLVAYAYMGMAASFSEIVRPPATTGRPAGSATTLTIYPHLDYEIAGGSYTNVFNQHYLTNHVVVQVGVATLDGQPIDGIYSPWGQVLYRTIGGLTVGTPVVVTFSVSISSGSLAGNDVPVSGAGYPGSTREWLSAVDALNTGYLLILDADGHGVVGESGFDYGRAPVESMITTTTSTTTSTTFVPPTTLPSCGGDAYCGDGIHQAECGEECECPETASGEADVACLGTGVVPPLAEACAVCVGCLVDRSSCVVSTTTSTTVSAVTTSTTTATTLPGIVTTTTLPPPMEHCGNCSDDDGNGLVDREDAACCAAPQPLVLRRAHLVPRRHHLSFDVTLPGAGATVSDLARGGLVVQLRAQGGPELLCLRLPALSRKGRRFVFRDPGGTRGGGITAVSLRTARADALLRLEGRKITLAGPVPADLLLTLGFETPGGCGAIQKTLRRQGRQGGLTFP